MSGPDGGPTLPPEGPGAAARFPSGRNPLTPAGPQSAGGYPSGSNPGAQFPAGPASSRQYSSGPQPAVEPQPGAGQYSPGRYPSGPVPVGQPDAGYPGWGGPSGGASSGAYQNVGATPFGHRPNTPQQGPGWTEEDSRRPTGPNFVVGEAPGRGVTHPSRGKLSPAKLIGLGVAAVGVLNFIWGFLPAVTTGSSSQRDTNLSVFAVGPAYVPILLLIAGLLAFGALLPGSDRSRLAVAAVAVGGAIGAIVSLGTPGVIEQFASSAQISKGLGSILLVVFGIVEAVLAIVGYVVGSGTAGSTRAHDAAAAAPFASGPAYAAGVQTHPGATGASAATDYAGVGAGSYGAAPATGPSGGPTGDPSRQWAGVQEQATGFGGSQFGSPGQVPPDHNATAAAASEGWRAERDQGWYGPATERPAQSPEPGTWTPNATAASGAPRHSAPAAEQQFAAYGRPGFAADPFPPTGHSGSPLANVSSDDAPTGPQVVVQPDAAGDYRPATQQPGPRHEVPFGGPAASGAEPIGARAPEAVGQRAPAPAPDAMSAADRAADATKGAAANGESTASDPEVPEPVDPASAPTTVYRRPTAGPNNEDQSQ